MAIKYNRLTLVQRDAGRSADNHIISIWRCDCGAEARIVFSRVKCGSTKSCGCLAREMSSLCNTTHGGRRSPEYSSWMAMRRRCEDPTDKDYPRYGGRGISICPEWSRSFQAFRDAMGARPEGTTLDRIDASKGYEPGNARWALPGVQGRNRRGTFIWHIKGKTFGSITEAAQEFSVSEYTVSRWVNGAFDKRRGTFTSPRSDCRAERRYA